jgi:hypothetical protein
MKTAISIIILTLTFFGCSDNKVVKKDNVESEKPKKASVDFAKQLLDFPNIKDSVSFISELRKTFDISVDESPEQKKNETITTFQKVNIYGSDKEFIFIEYDYKVGCMAAYPWKYQLLITPNGKLIKSISGQRYEFIEIFPNQNRFLLIVSSTAKGNGRHELYKFSADTLENVYEGELKTYDAHQDNMVNEPNELVTSVSDYNKDGFNDIAYRGNLVLIQGKTKDGTWFDSETINGKVVTYSTEYPFKKIPVDFIFLYDKKTGHFKQKENYLKKYGLDY